MINGHENPFSSGAVDRQEIWAILVEQDIARFLVLDWTSASADFAEDRFVGYSGSSNPDHWRIRFPDLRAYGEEWTRQAEAFSHVQLKDEDKASFLFRAAVLRDIEICGDRAAAHKKIDGRALTVDGNEIVLNWQTIYWLQRLSGKWKITGFLGYLPNPMPQTFPEAFASSINMPYQATQHKTAGPYSPILQVKSRGWVAISGQGPIDNHGNIVGDTLQEQTVATLENCKSQLKAAEASLADVFKVVVYLANIAEWDSFNEIYRLYFQPPYPVRTAVQAVLWRGIKVEIDLLAISH